MAITIPIKVVCPNPECPNKDSIEPFIPEQLSSRFSGDIIVHENLDSGTCTICGTTRKTVGEVFTFQQGVLERTSNFDEFRNGWVIHFTQCIQDVQISGTDEDFLRGRVTFTITRIDDLDNTDSRNFTCAIRLLRGECYSFETGPVEVVVPESLRQEVHYMDFRDAVERYFRLGFGSQGAGIRIGPGATNITMLNNVVYMDFYAVVHNRGNDNSAW